MTQAATIVELVQDEENRLWTVYMVAIAREHEAERLYEETWRDNVLASFEDRAKDQAWSEATKLLDKMRDDVDKARNAWRRVAYPQNNIPFSSEDSTSS